MVDQSRIQERLALATRRRQLMARRAILETQAKHWQALVRGAAALSRDYAAMDAIMTKFMIDMTVRGAQQEKAIYGELSSINLQIEGCTRDLSVMAASDDWRTMRDFDNRHQGGAEDV